MSELMLPLRVGSGLLKADGWRGRIPEDSPGVVSFSTLWPIPMRKAMCERIDASVSLVAIGNGGKSST